MFGIFKTAFRAMVVVGVAGAVLAGGTMLIAGKDRSAAILDQVRGELMDVIDDNIDDPVAMRSQLQRLEREYPKRIAQVRGDLAELRQQIRQVEHEKAISERVVALADEDLGEFEGKLAELRGVAGHAHTSSRLASHVRFDHEVYNVDRAVARVNQIRATRTAYGNRAADAGHELGYLRQQAQRFSEYLLRLETEHSEFQSQLWQLARQVDSIARNDRLIEQLDARNRTLEDCSRYKVASLDQLTQRLAEYRCRQEAELDVLTRSQRRVDYEDVARMQIETESFESYDSEPQPIRLVPIAKAIHSGLEVSVQTEIR